MVDVRPDRGPVQTDPLPRRSENARMGAARTAVGESYLEPQSRLGLAGVRGGSMVARRHRAVTMMSAAVGRFRLDARGVPALTPCGASRRDRRGA